LLIDTRILLRNFADKPIKKQDLVFFLICLLCIVADLFAFRASTMLIRGSHPCGIRGKGNLKVISVMWQCVQNFMEAIEVWRGQFVLIRNNNSTRL